MEYILIGLVIVMILYFLGAFIIDWTLAKKRTKIVVMCGSSRFTDIMVVCAWLIERDEYKNTMSLHLLPEWYCKNNIPHHLAEHEGVADEMDELHMRKIDLCDEIFIVNYEDYIGDSTKKELAYAKKLGKRIRWFTQDKIGDEVLQIIKESENE